MNTANWRCVHLPCLCDVTIAYTLVPTKRDPEFTRDQRFKIGWRLFCMNRFYFPEGWCFSGTRLLKLSVAWASTFFYVSIFICSWVVYGDGVWGFRALDRDFQQLNKRLWCSSVCIALCSSLLFIFSTCLVSDDVDEDFLVASKAASLKYLSKSGHVNYYCTSSSSVAYTCFFMDPWHTVWPSCMLSAFLIIRMAKNIPLIVCHFLTKFV